VKDSHERDQREAGAGVAPRTCGGGLAKDDAQAVQWYRKSAASGFTPAAERLKKLGE